jgi:hypothetical protein
MAQGSGDQDLMHYDQMVQHALRGVIKSALERAAAPGGLPGAHHLYISFKTRAPGVTVPPELVTRYPDEMAIVLQHQYWELSPGDTGFSVLLSFGGQPKRLTVPYVAVTRLHDPSVQFMLQFEPTQEELAAPSLAAPSEPVPLRPRQQRETEEAPVEAAEPEAPPADPDAPKIVSLDQFRKK